MTEVSELGWCRFVFFLLFALFPFRLARAEALEHALFDAGRTSGDHECRAVEDEALMSPMTEFRAAPHPVGCGRTCFDEDIQSPRGSQEDSESSRVSELCRMRQPSVTYDVCRRVVLSGLFSDSEIRANFP